MKPSTRSTTGLTAILITTLATTAFAGPLDPPSGTISSTMKTLDQVEPRIPINSDNTPGDDDSLFKITQSGSFYLTSNIRILNFLDPYHAIEIVASDVTLDFSGYSLSALLGALNAIHLGPGVENVTIINGTITGFTSGDGIDGATNSTSLIHIRDMRIENCINGVLLTEDSTVRDCFINDHAQWGISTGSRAQISDNRVMNCGASGIFNINGMHECVIEDNMLTGNARGFFVYGQRNIIVRNYVSSSTFQNWDCDSGNHMLVIDATPSNFAVGNSGGSSFGSSNPNANYSH
jgi:parallel beta-helix repeat protein